MNIIHLQKRSFEKYSGQKVILLEILGGGLILKNTKKKNRKHKVRAHSSQNIFILRHGIGIRYSLCSFHDHKSTLETTVTRT